MVATCYNHYVKINFDTFIDAKPETVLKTVFGYDSFRSYQKNIIQSVLNGKDTLAVMPTGGGKSLCYQIPALILKDITLVVSPLISLMQDQVNSLEANGIHSVFLNSTLSIDEYNQSLNDIKNHKVKLVFVSPEGLTTQRIRNLFTEQNINISCIAIDEAHCISQWGHDFRPDYLEIKNFRKLFPDTVILALTATATQTVQQDIIKNLNMKKPECFIASFNRPNIYLKVSPKRQALKQIIECIENHKNECGIIYCLSRRAVEELTEKLENLNYSVRPYHAGLADEVRAKNQDLFVKDKVQIIVATIAFGMGINKPNVRFVINYDLPKSIEEYYQEIGRAGRDGLNSEALLLFTPADIHKIRYFFKDSANPQNSEILLKKMVDFCTAKSCRRKNLLAYFGETYKFVEDDEYCCDVCSLKENPVRDLTIPSQKLFCCILRTYERYGSSYIIDILLGIESQRILENNHDTLSTWGIGQELEKSEWFELINTLIEEDYLIKYGQYNILKLTSKARHALMTNEQINLAFYTSEPAVKPLKKSATAQKPAQTDKTAQLIIEQLKAWRTRKANDFNVPPYIIFGDKTLYDLAAKKPSNKTELRSIYGLGTSKIEQFGNSILQIINDIVLV